MTDTPEWAVALRALERIGAGDVTVGNVLTLWLDGENDTDDSFLYARAWVVAQGLKAWESVLEDPAQFPKSREQWCESLLYMAGEAWAEVTGNAEDDWDFEASVSYETGSNEEQW